jgi:hypothetical protein
MNGEELEDAMRKLLEFVITQGMQWMLDEVDEAIALGVPETRTLRQPTSRQGLTTYEDVTAPDASPFPGQGRSRRTGRSTEFIRSRPMTPREQAQLLVQALGRVLADLEAVAVGSLEALDPATLSDYVAPDLKTSSPTSRYPLLTASPSYPTRAALHLRSALMYPQFPTPHTGGRTP